MRYVYYEETRVYQPRSPEPEKEPDLAEILGKLFVGLILFFLFCAIIGWLT